MSAISLIIQHRHLIKKYVQRDLASRYKGSILGFFWTLIQPLVLIIIYSYVFSSILQVKMGASSSGTTNFALYLFSGMLPWLAFSDAVSRSAGIIIENSHIIKKMVFPVAILPVYVTISCAVLELISLSIFILAIYFITHSLSWLIILLPLVIAIQLMLTLGFAWLFATLNVFIRDIGQILSLILTAWMFLTPIFYPAAMVPDRFRLMLQINPFYYIVEAYRDLLLNQRFPEPKGLVIAAGMALLSYLFGYWFFSRAKDAFIDVI